MAPPPDTRILRVRTDGDPVGIVRPPQEGYLEPPVALPDFYDISFEYVFEPGVASRPRREGTKDPRNCRVCPPGTTGRKFRDDAHIIPQGLGNRALQTWEECDACNHDIGNPLETALISSLALVRALSTIKSKAGRVVSHRPRTEAFVSNREVDGERAAQVLMSEADPAIRGGIAKSCG